MRIAAALALTALVASSGTALRAEVPSATIDEAPAIEVAPSRAERIDTLLEALKASTDADEAKRAERDVIRLWLESGSDTIDLLMKWAISAMEQKKYPRALDFLDRVVTMKPDYAEGWNKRATVFFLMEDYGKSITDIGRVLELEPRHFGALSGLGMIMRALGDDDRAMEAYREVLVIHPHLDGVKKELEDLEAKRFGRDL